MAVELYERTLDSNILTIPYLSDSIQTIAIDISKYSVPIVTIKFGNLITVILRPVGTLDLKCGRTICLAAAGRDPVAMCASEHIIEIHDNVYYVKALVVDQIMYACINFIRHPVLPITLEILDLQSDVRAMLTQIFYKDLVNVIFKYLSQKDAMCKVMMLNLYYSRLFRMSTVYLTPEPRVNQPMSRHVCICDVIGNIAWYFENTLLCTFDSLYLLTRNEELGHSKYYIPVHPRLLSRSSIRMNSQVLHEEYNMKVQLESTLFADIRPPIIAHPSVNQYDLRYLQGNSRYSKISKLWIVATKNGKPLRHNDPLIVNSLKIELNNFQITKGSGKYFSQQVSYLYGTNRIYKYQIYEVVFCNLPQFMPYVTDDFQLFNNSFLNLCDFNCTLDVDWSAYAQPDHQLHIFVESINSLH